MIYNMRAYRRDTWFRWKLAEQGFIAQIKLNSPKMNCNQEQGRYIQCHWSSMWRREKNIVFWYSWENKYAAESEIREQMTDRSFQLFFFFLTDNIKLDNHSWTRVVLRESSSPETMSSVSSALQADSLPTEPLRKPFHNKNPQ